jgi:hypothetical protein
VRSATTAAAAAVTLVRSLGVADHAVDGLAGAFADGDQPDRARRRRVEVSDDEQSGVGAAHP